MYHNIVFVLNKLSSVQMESTCRLLYIVYKIIHQFEMFDRMDKKNNVIGFKTNSALALFTSILAENTHV